MPLPTLKTYKPLNTVEFRQKMDVASKIVLLHMHWNKLLNSINHKTFYALTPFPQKGKAKKVTLTVLKSS